MELNLFNLLFSNYGMELTTVLGDIYIPYETFFLVVGITIVLRIRNR